MKFVCPVCLLDPLNHSLSKFLEKDNILYFYTCPSKAKLYNDLPGIIFHYNGVLSEIPKNKKWIWIFDGFNFNLNHFLEINIAFEIAKLISTKFSENLLNIIIINPTFYINSTYNIIYPFLNEKIKSLIKINYDIKNIENINNENIN